MGGRTGQQGGQHGLQEKLRLVGTQGIWEAAAEAAPLADLAAQLAPFEFEFECKFQYEFAFEFGVGRWGGGRR